MDKEARVNICGSQAFIAISLGSFNVKAEKRQAQGKARARKRKGREEQGHGRARAGKSKRRERKGQHYAEKKCQG